MKFVDLYIKSKDAVRDTLTSMWCSDCHNESQIAYANKLRSMIDDFFAPNDAMPLVQCMNQYEAVKSVDVNSANKLIDGLWTKKYSPYEHQYQCWKTLSSRTLDQKVKSIVVTTGTGSGKTECFMLPLIADLSRRRKEKGLNLHSIQAIFLYPLNALMEDQKERLQEYINGTGLTFAVYNGNLPETDDLKDTSLHQRIEAEKAKYPSIITTRSEMRREKVDIILTNPTMLEYMLLRDKDNDMFTPESLKWIVIDETHTYTGSAAAELSMLMRRVMIAFGVNSDVVRFATSSATIGNGEDEGRADDNLKNFICGITGQEKEQIDIIKGVRIDSSTPLKEKTADDCKKKLFKYEYLRLDELIEGDSLTIEQRLEKLDQYCDLGLKAKVHFFHKVLSQGLKVNLSKHVDGRFEIFSEIPSASKATEPYLDLMRCSCCGEYVAVGQYKESDTSTFSATTITDNDMFDFSEREAKRKIIFALTKDDSITPGTKNNFVEVSGNKMTEIKPAEGQWKLVRNTGCECPYCSNKFGKLPKKTKKSDKEKSGVNRNTSTDTNADVEMENKSITSFRLSADFVSRIIAPRILDNLSKSDGEKPHDGQQYISFVDSRQAAAQATLQQNLEQERLWVYSRIFNELNKRKLAVDKNKETLLRMSELKKQEQEFDKKGDDAAAYKALKEWKKLNETVKDVKASHLTWIETFNLLKESPECDYLCEQFAKRTKGSDEIDEGTGKPTDEMKTKYVYAVMIELLSRRPSSANAPETMGLFCSYYPRLEDKIVALPQSVIEFNKLITKDEDKITLCDWKDLLKIFLDYNVRSNMSVFLRDPKYKDFDIKEDYQRFATQKVPTRTPRFPSLRYASEEEAKEDGEQQGKIKTNPGNVIILLTSLIEGDFKGVAEKHEDAINSVLKDFEKALVEDTIDGADGGLLEPEQKEFTKVRMNLTKLAFKLYDTVALCDTRHYSKGQKWPVYRPIDTLFKGYSPYLFEGKACKPLQSACWDDVYPYVDGKKEGEKVSAEEIENWGRNNRSLLWENGLWGESGCFSNRYKSILSYPKIFIQAEHTAQIDKLIAKQSQDQFKTQDINILACSTTMEMGIDLGNLELVLMNSIPPHPANYKQRAGRSGRDINAVRSACITMCGTDSIGLRTMRNPIETLIERKTEIPIVDLNSRQVIQRHVNSYLLRESKVFSRDNKNANNMDQQIIEFFTPFAFGTLARFGARNYEQISNKDTDEPVYPTAGLGDFANTKYYVFVNWLTEEFEVDNNFNRLIKDTHFHEQAYKVIANSLFEIERCYKELSDRAQTIGRMFAKYVSELKEKEEFSSDQELFNYINTNDSGWARRGRMLKFKYSELLSQGLLPYLATHRFTPNANMPVNVIEFDVNLNNVHRGSWSNDKPSNPSYALQEALAQYAPGNTIILSNRVKVVRGLLTTGAFKDNNTFKKVLTDGNNVVIETENENKLTSRIKWPVNGKEELELIQPYAFIPDVNESDTRHVEHSSYTRVDAQLIGAGEWYTSDNGTHLISVRASEESGDASILYYNDGIGYGYCYCPNCGKTSLEQGTSTVTPNDFDDYTAKDGRCHKDIQKLGTKAKPELCKSTAFKKVRRNVIIGNTIQTDYCEIKVRRSTSGDWINDSNDSLTLTIALIFTKLLAERIGVEQRDMSFTIMPNGNICIYDTNPGGSGYSKRLGDIALLNSIIDDARIMLKCIKSKEEILDRYTMRYRDEIDTDQVKEWIEKEIECRGILPEIIRKHFPSAVESNMSSLVEDCSYPHKEKVDVFVSTANGFLDWNYNDGDMNWRTRIDRFRDKKIVSLNIISQSKELPIPIKSMLQPATDWVGKRIHFCNNPLPEGLYPIALVDNKLFFTTELDDILMNHNWAKHTIYCVQTQAINAKLKQSSVSLTITNSPTISKFTIGDSDKKLVNTRELPEIVYNKCKAIVDQFAAYVKGLDNSHEIIVTYQDEHLKSCLGMVATFQFIEHFIKLFGKKFRLAFQVEDYTKNSYETEGQLKITGDLPQHYRDIRLNEMIEEWNNVCQSNELDGCASELVPQEAKTLPHWRVLTFQCGGKQLDIYPNGGIINEWYLSRAVRNTVHYTYRDISCQDVVNLQRYKDIMYDVELKDA